MKIGIEIKWAFIFIIMMMLWMLMERLTGLHSTSIDKHATYTNFVAIPAILVYVLALRDKRNNYYNGFITYKQGFKAGLIMTVIITLLSPLLQYITQKFITPDYFSNMIRYTVDQKKATLEQAQKDFNLKSYIIMGTAFTFCIGLVTTAIVAAFTRRTPKAVKNQFLPNT